MGLTAPAWDRPLSRLASVLPVLAALAAAAPAGAATARVDVRMEPGTKGSPTPVGFLRIDGDATGEALEVTDHGTVVLVRGPVVAGEGCTEEAPGRVRCPRTADLQVALGDGDDVLRHRVAPDVPAERSAGAVAADGGEGADVLDVQAAIAQLGGGPGDDALRADVPSPELTGGPGADRLEAIGATGRPGATLRWPEPGGVHVDVAAGTAQTPTGQDTFTGPVHRAELGPDDDRLVAGSRGIEARGSGGADVLVGGDGADRLHGDAGSDRLEGGGGDDEVYAGSDRGEVLRGGDGDDRLVLTEGDVDGGAGDDDLLLAGNRGPTADRRVVVRCGTGADDVEDPGAHTPLGRDCETVRSSDPEGTTLRFTRTSTGGVRLQARGRRCVRRAAAGGRVLRSPRTSRWSVTLLRRAPARPALVRLSRCDGRRLHATATWVTAR